MKKSLLMLFVAVFTLTTISCEKSFTYMYKIYNGFEYHGSSMEELSDALKYLEVNGITSPGEISWQGDGESKYDQKAIEWFDGLVNKIDEKEFCGKYPQNSYVQLTLKRVLGETTTATTLKESKKYWGTK
ncbi:MAG: hypothetical protein HUJ90_07280 [Bacteroidales bacterium]|nr:hypothetical protein [Bacteroidales bacterium]